MLNSSSDLSSQYANLYNAEQARELDRYAIEEFGIPGIVLMKRAGQAILNEILDVWPESSHLTIFCGPGNNGGDGYIVAGLAKQKNIAVSLIETSGSSASGDAELARNFAITEGAQPVDADEWLKAPDFIEGAIIVDALLGTGFSGELRAPYAELITHINQSGLSVVSADIPSGLSADTGAVGEPAVEADLTITFIGSKIGLFTGQGRAYSGDIVFDDLGIPADVYENVQPLAEILDFDDLLERLPQRSETNHKGSHGHVLIVGGDLGFAGAPLMAAEAAARIGAGLVSVVTRLAHCAAINSRIPEVMVSNASDTQRFQELLSKATVIVVGPGLGMDAWGQKLLQSVLAANKPMVIDADALNMIAAGLFGSGLSNLELDSSVITPHPGEASRLLGITTQEINQNRIAAVKQLQKSFGSTALLKGSGTLICSEVCGSQQLNVCPYGNPGMGSGGMGDVLSGIIGGLMAQGMVANEAARLGACVHACAADILSESEGERGLLATDLIDEVRRLLNGF